MTFYNGFKEQEEKMEKRKFKTFKYLHRDGDGDMSFMDLVKREFTESKTQVAQARQKMDQSCVKDFVKWIKYYHRGMFFKPHFSRELITLKYKSKECKNTIDISFRKNQSDIYILRENFVSNIYDFNFEKYIMGDIETIVDLGANIGLSSLYFQYRFPKAMITCVEPVQDNIDVLTKNKNQNKFNWNIVKGAIQDKEGTVTLHPNEWWSSSTVTEKVANSRENKDGRLEKILKMPTEDVNAYTLDSIMSMSNMDHIDILKMDIEGAEEDTILNAGEWIKNVKILIVEIHVKYVNRQKIEDKLHELGFVEMPERQVTDVFIRKEMIK